MTRKEFENWYYNEKIDIGIMDIELDIITDASFVLGCCLVDGKWVVYSSGERYGHEVIEEFTNENNAFNLFQELVLYYADLAKV